MGGRNSLAGGRGLQWRNAVAKGTHRPWPAINGATMSLPAAGIILLFLVVFGVLNRIEFGRFD